MIKRKMSLILLVLTFLFLTSCQKATRTKVPNILSPTEPAPTEVVIEEVVPRTQLTYSQLMSGFEYTSPFDLNSMRMPVGADLPDSQFEGTLELVSDTGCGELKVYKGNIDQTPLVSCLGGFRFDFVQSGQYLIPVQRAMVISEHPVWNYILEPGNVWIEEDDQGYARASFPITLVWKSSNAVFNGVMTFLFNQTQVSNVWYEFVQEISISTSADLWGLAEAHYKPGTVQDAEMIKSAFQDELAAKFPTKAIEDLARDYQGIDISAFGRGVDPNSMNWYGVVAGGINYIGGCQTRYGKYPYCEAMRASSYSTAKSAFVSVALMRLAQKYDPKLPEALIKDYVPEAASSPGNWQTVTFNNTIDMATGNYKTAAFMVDEETWDTDPFWNEDYYPQIIAAAFNWPNSAPPGKQWVYRTSDTFIVTRALHNFLQSREGDSADIFNFVVDEVYKPLKLGPGAFSVMRTKENNWQGQPYGGLGMWWIPDDLAKISTFLNLDDGAINSEQILDPDILAAALQRDKKDRGVDINKNSKYNNAFWADRYNKANGFKCEIWVAEMLGYSGIVVVLAPNGTSYYYASDHRDFTWLDAVRELDKIKPFCK